jgi:hypothetical protein
VRGDGDVAGRRDRHPYDAAKVKLATTRFGPPPSCSVPRITAHQKINQHGDLGRPRPARRGEDVESDRRRRPSRHDRLETPLPEIAPDDELRLNGEPETGAECRHQRIGIVDAQRPADRDGEHLARRTGELPAIVRGQIGIAEAGVFGEFARVRRPPSFFEVIVRANQEVAHLTETPGKQARIGQCGDAQCEIEAADNEIDGRALSSPAFSTGGIGKRRGRRRIAEGGRVSPAGWNGAVTLKSILERAPA